MVSSVFHEDNYRPPSVQIVQDIAQDVGPRTDGENQNLLTQNLKPTNMLGENEDKKEKKYLVFKSWTPKRKQVYGRGGAPALMYRQAVVKATPSPEKSGLCAHTAGRPYSDATIAPVSWCARFALDKVRVLFK